MSDFVWGTVTAVSPFRVRLDGDTAELPFSSDSLVTAQSLTVADRVRVELSGTRVIVHGRNGGDGALFTGLDSRVGDAETAITALEALPVAGSTLVTRQTFSGNSLTLDPVFDAAVSDIYEVIVDLSSTSVATGIAAIMRSSGSDYTTGNQTTRRFEMNGATPAYANSSTATALEAGRANGTGGGYSRFTVASPASAQYTRVQGASHDHAISRSFWNDIPNTNIFTGIKIKLDGSVTGSGVVSVYALGKV